MSNYIDPVLQKIADVIKANGKIQTFYFGDPLKVVASNLPACVLTKNGTRAGQVTNAEDGHEIGITITIITDIRQDLSTEDNIALITPGVATLYEMIEGRGSDYKLNANSVLNLLRSNQLLDSVNNLRIDLEAPTRIDYGVNLRQREPAQWTTEANIDIVVNFIQLR